MGCSVPVLRKISWAGVVFAVRGFDFKHYDFAAYYADNRRSLAKRSRQLPGRGSFGLGAGKLRTVFSIVLPCAVPGILSGVILGIRAYRRGNRRH